MRRRDINTICSRSGTQPYIPTQMEATLTCYAQQGDLAKLKALLRGDVSQDSMESALAAAATNGRYKALKLLLRDCRVETQMLEDCAILNATIMSQENGCFICAKILISDGRCDLTRGNGRTRRTAMYCGKPELVEYIQ